MANIKLDWGLEGLEFAQRSSDIVVVVDALRFSSAAVTAVAAGFTVYPVSDLERGKQLADQIGAELAGQTGHARYSLSPLSFLTPEIDGNRRVVLCSANGAACAEKIEGHDAGFVGCFLNAAAVAARVTDLADEKGLDVTVIAAGEPRAVETDGRIVYVPDAAAKVFAIEDYLASGAIISHSCLRKSPEAEVCGLAFSCVRDRLAELLLDSPSGRYLTQRGFGADVEHAARLNLYGTVPTVRDGMIGDDTIAPLI